jgi:hypothetical protein
MQGVSIFISHKKEDENKAIIISNYIKEKYGFHTYVDALDPEIQEYDNVTGRIVDKLRESTHLLVIFSEHTIKSMWVPFELGVAYEREEGIGVYIWPDEELSYDLPEYLDEFPKLKNKKHLDEYLNLINEIPTKEQLILERSESLGYKVRAKDVNYAREFINMLNKRLYW